MTLTVPKTTEWSWATGEEPLLVLDNLVAFDLETEGLDPTKPEKKILTCGVSTGSKNLVYRDVTPIVNSLYELQQSGAIIVGHNACSFDREWLIRKTAIAIPVHDTMLMAYILDETQPLGLQPLAMKYLGVKEWKDEVTWDWDKFQFLAAEDPKLWDLCGAYNARDAQYTRQLALVLMEQLDLNGQWQVYDKVLRETTWSVRSLRYNGYFINRENTANVLAEYEKERDLKLNMLHSYASEHGHPNLNPNSPKQLGKLFFETFKYPVIKKSEKTGAPSTDELTLKKLQGVGNPHDIFLTTLLENRGLVKAIGTYLKPFLAVALAAPDSRGHSEYMLVRTDTGRTATAKGDLPVQTVPRVKKIRSMIGARPGYIRVQADYSQLEMRLMAFLSRCPNLIDAFLRGDDVHRLIAADITGKRPEDVTSAERSDAKPANFGFLYGAEVGTFLGIMLKDYDKVLRWSEGTKMRQAFFGRWTGLEAYYRLVWAELAEYGYVKSKTGRRRHLEKVYTGEGWEKTAALREAINFTDQSFATDIALIGMNHVHEAGFFITDFLHDSVGMEVPQTEDLLAIKEELQQLMVTDTLAYLDEHFGVRIDIPILVDVQAGPHWGALEDIK